MNWIDINKDRIEYTTKHKKALEQLYANKKHLIATHWESIVIETLDCAIYLHDSDKLAMYERMSVDDAQKIHRAFSNHHFNKLHMNEEDMIEMVLDWECARETKPDKQLTAWEFLHTLELEPHMYRSLKSIMGILQLEGVPEEEY